MTSQLLVWCQWLEATGIGTAVRESSLLFPLVLGTHLLALGISVGTTAIWDLRLLGVTLKQEPVSEVMGQLLPWSMAGFAGMFISGALLFSSEATYVFDSPWFLLKIACLMLAGVNALVYHLTIERRIHEWDRQVRPPGAARLAGAMSLTLWTVVIIAGRTTAYSL
ncbi:MAG: DUF6644 family protein [Vicinamibacterales bacterium]